MNALSPLPTTWTPQAVETLQRLWQTGASTAVIGQVLGCSRSAVAGKIHRLGLLKRRAGGPKKIPTPTTPDPNTNLFRAFTPLPTSVIIPFTQTKPSHCRWPVGGQGIDMLCCGQTISQGAYCDSHARTASRKTGFEASPNQRTITGHG